MDRDLDARLLDYAARIVTLVARLLAKSGKLKENRMATIIDESTQLRSILSKAVATAKKNQRSAS